MAEKESATSSLISALFYLVLFNKHHREYKNLNDCLKTKTFFHKRHLLPEREFAFLFRPSAI